MSSLVLFLKRGFSVELFVVNCVSLSITPNMTSWPIMQKKKYKSFRGLCLSLLRSWICIVISFVEVKTIDSVAADRFFQCCKIERNRKNNWRSLSDWHSGVMNRKERKKTSIGGKELIKKKKSDVKQRLKVHYPYHIFYSELVCYCHTCELFLPNKKVNYLRKKMM